MIRKLLFVCLVASFCLSAFAEDYILLRNGNEIICKVLSVNSGSISYNDASGATQDVDVKNVYMVKYEKQGNVFFDTSGAPSFNTNNGNTKISKKEIAIYLRDGEEVMATEIQILADIIHYKPTIKKTWSKILSTFGKSGDWYDIPKEEVFLVRYNEESRYVINSLDTQESDPLANLPKVKHPFISINKNYELPFPAEITLRDGAILSAVLYDIDREYIYYRQTSWINGPIYRMNHKKIKNITTKN